MANIDELLQQRYGAARFNPAAGQTQMSFQEWMDRHPALQGRGGDKNFTAYHAQTQDNQLGENPGAIAPPKQYQGTPGQPGTATLGQGPGSVTPPVQQLPVLDSPEITGSLGAPDAPPSPPNAHPNVGQGMDYKTFLSKRGVNARKSSASNAAAWRRTQAKKPKTPGSSSGNTQQAH